MMPIVRNMAKERTCAYQGLRNVRSSIGYACFVFLVTPVLRFTLLPYCRRNSCIIILLELA